MDLYVCRAMCYPDLTLRSNFYVVVKLASVPWAKFSAKHAVDIIAMGYGMRVSI